METVFTVLFINEDGELETETAKTDMPYQPIASEHIDRACSLWSANAQVGDTYLGDTFFVIRTR
jgi:hypothetical protein